ncbi:MAG: hypothetical protein Q8K08_20655 [Pseudotabrizicola sp.]|nr:hypothetical protein [Pseudotabrizicola sp.]
MNLLRKLTLVAGTGAIALGAGHYVQEKAGSRTTVGLPDVVVSGVMPVAAGREELTPPSKIIQAPVLPGEPASIVDTAPLPQDSVPDQLAAADPVELAPLNAPPMTALEMAAKPDCDVRFDLLAQPNAMIGISMLAPCQPDQRVVLRHAGLAVTERTSASGALFAMLPALTAVADVEVIFPGGEKASGSLPMPDFAGVQRFAVQWQANDAFQLHAFENGAGYDQPGHISSSFTGTSGETGFVTVLGNALVNLPLLAEVYTFGPTDQIDLVLESAITDRTCGREILGEAILAKDGLVEISDLTLAMPDCDAVGDILVLKNLLENMTLTSAN